MITTDQPGAASGAAAAQWADPAWLPPATSTVRRWAPLMLWLVCLASAVVVLRMFGGGRLAVPATTDPMTWWTWVTTGDPLTVTMGVLRVVALGLAWYLTGVTGVSVVARVLRVVRLVRVADALSFGPVRVLAQQAVGLSLATGVLVTSVPGGAADVGDGPGGRHDVAVMVPIEEPAAAAPVGLALRETIAAPVPAPSSASDRLPVPVPTQPTVVTPPPDQEAPRDAAVDGPTPSDREWQVAPGDHFWSIAETEVATHLGRPGTEDEVLDHWEALVAANVDRLVVAGNPDLLLPDQWIRLPEVAS